MNDRAAFLLVLGGAGLRVYPSYSLWIEARVSAGVGVLTNASTRSFLFRGANEVTGTFATFVVRPAVGLGWQVWRGLTAVVWPLALDYSPRRSDYAPGIGAIRRYHVACGLSWQP